MGHAVIILPRAARQVSAAVFWWREHRPLAPSMLEDEIARTVSRIGEMPNAGVRVRGRPGVRRIALRSSRYALYYRVMPRARRVEVLALWHSSRGGAAMK